MQYNIELTNSHLLPNLEMTASRAYYLQGTSTQALHDRLKYFDKDGYELTNLESSYALTNGFDVNSKLYKYAIQYDWYTQDSTDGYGAVIDHSLLLHRPYFAGTALDELKYHAKQYPMLHKLIQVRPKWGIDFSIDWIDDSGALELVHFEYDSYHFEQAVAFKVMAEQIIGRTNWQDFSKDVYNLQHKWCNLGGVEQSNYKSNMLGISTVAEQPKKTW